LGSPALTVFKEVNPDAIQRPMRGQTLMRATLFLAAVMVPVALRAHAEAQQQQPGKLSDAEAKRVAALIQHLDSKKFPERERAMKELAAFGERVLPTLEKAAKGPVALEVRRRLNQVIHELRAPEQMAALVQQLGSPYFRHREAATRELETLGPSALKPLRAAVRGPDWEVARRAEILIDRILQQKK
jgi:hypothetical protein